MTNKWDRSGQAGYQDSRLINVDDARRKQDRVDFHFVLEQDIRALSAEILRLIRMPYKSKHNQERIHSIDKQIEYLEHMLAGMRQEQGKL